MLQSGDAAIASWLKSVAYCTIALLFALMFRLFFIVATGFAPLFLQDVASTVNIVLPSFSYQVPLVVVALCALMLHATYRKGLILPTAIGFVAAFVLSIGWSWWPAFLGVFECFSRALGSNPCSGTAVFIGTLDLILLTAVTLAFFIGAFCMYTYMQLSFQRDYYMIEEAEYYNITDRDDYTRNRYYDASDDENDEDEDTVEQTTIEDEDGDGNQRNAEEDDLKSTDNADAEDMNKYTQDAPVQSTARYRSRKPQRDSVGAKRRLENMKAKKAFKGF